MGRAIVTYGRGWQALAVLRSLGRRGIEVYCGEEAPFAPSFFSRYCTGSFRYPSFADSPEDFIDFMVEKVQELAPPAGEPYVLLPVHKETWLFAKHRERFEPHISLPLTSHEKMARVHDKGALALLAEELGILIPPTRQFQSLDEVYRSVPDLKFPVFLKVREGASGVGIKKCNSPEELTRSFREFVDGYGLSTDEFPLVQEGIDGEDHCVSALFDRGRCVAKMTYRNVRVFPRTTGASALRQAVPLPDGEAAAVKLLSHLDWHGIAELDFRVGTDGRAYLIEVNPRFFGGLPQALASNVDYPWLMYRIATGEHVTEEPEIDYEARTETPVTALLASLDEALRDERTLGRMQELRDELSALGQSDVRELRLREFWDNLKRKTRPGDLAAVLREKFGVHRSTIDDIIQSDDPLPVLGILYPLGIMFTRGEISMGALTSEADLASKKPRRRFRDLVTRPRWSTLALTALLFSLATFLINWQVTRDNIGFVLGAPLRLTERIFGELLTNKTLMGAFLQTLSQLFHLVAYYLAAALIMRESRSSRGERPDQRRKGKNGLDEED
jgi:predicted ATP-grasp superfamily ATP-dependent carboligase